MKTRYLIIKYDYSPDFGLENPRPIKLFKHLSSAETFQQEEIHNTWRAIINTDKSNWIYGDHYAYYKEELIPLGYHEKEMSDAQIKAMMQQISLNETLASFIFCTIKTVEER